MMKKIVILLFLMFYTTAPMLYAVEIPSSQLGNELSTREHQIKSETFSSPVLRDAIEGTPCPNCFGGVIGSDGSCNNCDYVLDGNHGTGTETPGPITDAWPIIFFAAIIYGIIRRRKLSEQD